MLPIGVLFGAVALSIVGIDLTILPLALLKGLQSAWLAIAFAIFAWCMGDD